MPNNVALDVHAAELFDWSYDLGQVKEERKSRRGFDTAMKQPKISRWLVLYGHADDHVYDHVYDHFMFVFMFIYDHL